jgi:hypothetical protein
MAWTYQSRFYPTVCEGQANQTGGFLRQSRTQQSVDGSTVDTKAEANGEVKIYYVLGEHGLCGNPDWASCLYRMACIKCPFFIPRDCALLIQSRKTVKRFMEIVELTDEELAAVQDDYDKLEEAVQRTQHLQAPTILRRRAKGSQSRGIPLTVLNSTQLSEQRQNTGTL